MDASSFFDPLGLAIVLGGAVLVACLRSTRADMAGAMRAVGPLLRADPEADGHAARVAVGRLQALAQVRDLSCADRLETTQRFLRSAARRLSDAPCPRAFAAWGDQELSERSARHAGAQGWWRSMADAAPAMGLIGTVIGLIRMFAAMDDAARIGPAMALAMLTTLYGIVLANLVAGPVAARLARLSAGELAWQRRTIDSLVALAEAEQSRHPPVRALRGAA